MTSTRTPKNAVASLTIRGQIILVLGLLKSVLDWDVLDSPDIEQYVDLGIVVAGLTATFVGRWRQGDLYWWTPKAKPPVVVEDAADAPEADALASDE